MKVKLREMNDGKKSTLMTFGSTQTPKKKKKKVHLMMKERENVYVESIDVYTNGRYEESEIS